jgi:hypothetical protein
MSFSTISTFSSLKFSNSGLTIISVYPNLDGSMSVYYTFDYVANAKIPNFYNFKNGLLKYDANIIGDGIITNTLPNYIMGKGALQLTNDTTTTQYVQTTSKINTSTYNNCLSISVWFNPSSLSETNLYTLFDIIGNVGNKGIQIDLSGINTICYGYYDTFVDNLFFIVDSSMSIYYPLNSAIDNYLPNYNNAEQNSVVYDGSIIGNGSINNNTENYIIGNGALKLTNNTNSTATQYVNNSSTISTSGLDGLTISIWFNPSNMLINNNNYTIFDIASNIGTKGIQLDLSGTNTICSGLYY